MMHDDLQLLIRTHRGHETSARLLWERHASRLEAHARSIVTDPNAASDIVQTVMCRILELPGRRVREIQDVPAFLASAVRREAINHIRSSRREQARREAAPKPNRAGPPLSAPSDLHAAVDALPRRLREVVVLKHVADLTLDQISAALGANRNTIASRYRAAIESLRGMLAPEEGVLHV
jgi:RNA polymerase sigma factor (sigma-70 family)